MFVADIHLFSSRSTAIKDALPNRSVFFRWSLLRTANIAPALLTRNPSRSDLNPSGDRGCCRREFRHLRCRPRSPRSCVAPSGRVAALMSTTFCCSGVGRRSRGSFLSARRHGAGSSLGRSPRATEIARVAAGRSRCARWCGGHRRRASRAGLPRRMAMSSRMRGREHSAGAASMIAVSTVPTDFLRVEPIFAYVHRILGNVRRFRTSSDQISRRNAAVFTNRTARWIAAGVCADS